MRMRSLGGASAALMLLTGCHSSSSLPKSSCVERTYKHKYGVVVEPDYWHYSGRNGEVITSLRDGVTIKQTFAHGKLNGETCYTFPLSDAIRKKEVFEEDQLCSEVEYSRSGTPLWSREYSSPDSWTTTCWYDSGRSRSVERYEREMLLYGEYYNKKNHKDSWVHDGAGERYTRDDEGNLLSVDTFRGGELAMRTFYHPNGNPKEINPIAKGQIHGERKTFYPAGEPMSIEMWHQGKQQGLTTIFQNGEKYSEVPYLAGKKQGVERRFNNGETVTQEISWYNDKMHGPTYTYLGDSVQTDWFYAGRLTTRSNFESFATAKSKKTIAERRR